MIEEFYNETFTPVRYSTSAYDSADTATTGTAFSGLFRPISDKARLFIESNIGKEADVVCDDSNDVRVGDILIGSIQGELTVIGVSDYTDLENDSDSHLDIRVVRKNAGA